MHFIKETLIGRWGLLLLLIVLGGLWLLFQYAAARTGLLEQLLVQKRTVMLTGGGYAVLFAVSWLSFPHIYKTRVFLSGPAFLAIGAAMVLQMTGRWQVLPGYDTTLLPRIYFYRSLILLSTFNLLLLGFLPTYMEYRNVRRWAAVLSVTEILLLYVWFRHAVTPAPAAAALVRGRFVPVMLGLSAGILVLAVVRMADDAKLGGAWAGLALFLVFFCTRTSPVTGMAFLSVLPLVLIFSNLNNWFTSLYHRAQYDPLLHIYNRDFYQSVVEGKSTISLGSEYCVAVSDLDHFKKINDRAGHQTGDKVLVGVAQTIRRVALPRGITCRYGGEEIVIFFRKTDLETAVEICEKIRQEVGKLKFKAGRRNIKVTCSIGVASNKKHGTDVEKVLGLADKAVYQAKKTGRNKVVKK